MAIISNGTTIASGGSLSVSANPPSTAGAIGTYVTAVLSPNGTANFGDGQGGSGIKPCNSAGGPQGSALSGGWRCMGQTNGDSNSSSTTLFIRIS